MQEFNLNDSKVYAIQWKGDFVKFLLGLLPYLGNDSLDSASTKLVGGGYGRRALLRIRHEEFALYNDQWLVRIGGKWSVYANLDFRQEFVEVKE